MKTKHDLRRLLKDHKINYQWNTDFDSYVIKSLNGIRINTHQYKSAFEKKAGWLITSGWINPNDKTHFVVDDIETQEDIAFINIVFGFLEPFLQKKEGED